MVRLFTAIGCFILLLACINFMNLSTARSNKRAKEVGLRKTVGSGRGQLITQFLGESLLMTCLSLVIAIGLAALLMPVFDRLAGKQLVFPWASPGFWLAAGCFTILIGLLAGSYPAFYLSGFRPVEVLKGVFVSGRNAVAVRKVLVVVQFTISIALIIGILVVHRQIRYAQDRSVGYTRAGLITVSANGPGLIEHFDAFRDELMRSGGVSEVAASSSPTTDVENDMLGYDWKGRDPNSAPAIGTLFVGYDFGKTVGWQLKEGRDFSRDFPTDSGAFIINEAAARYMGLLHPVGEFIRWHEENHPIVGVVRDMVMKSPYSPVEPTFFTLRTDRRIHVITVRLNPGLTRQAALAIIQPVFLKYSSASPFDYSFTEEDYSAKFRAESRLAISRGCLPCWRCSSPVWACLVLRPLSPSSEPGRSALGRCLVQACCSFGVCCRASLSCWWWSLSRSRRPLPGFTVRSGYAGLITGRIFPCGSLWSRGSALLRLR